MKLIFGTKSEEQYIGKGARGERSREREKYITRTIPVQRKGTVIGKDASPFLIRVCQAMMAGRGSGDDDNEDRERGKGRRKK